MTRREELLSLRDTMDIVREEFEEDYARVEEELKNTCDCENCACSDECEGEGFDDECDYETVVDCELNGKLGIQIEQCLECGEKIATIQDLEDGDIITLTERQLATIVKLMEVE
jgi:hypothetical protein